MPPKATKKYTKMDPIDHVLKRSDMYVGSTRLRNTEEYIAINNDEGGFRIVKKEMSSCPAIIRIFVEPLSNAIDNVERSRKANNICSKIKVSINPETGETSVWNDGEIVPIELVEDGSCYNHSMIFGQLLTGSNYNDEEERVISGRNGLGVKLTSIFSLNFRVDGVDPVNGKMFVQEWTNNMKTTTGPVVSVSKLKKGYTEVTWTPDFSRFGLTNYSPDIISLYTRYVIDAAMLSKIDVYFNEELIPIKNIVQYSKLYESPTEEFISIKTSTSDVVVTTANDFQDVSFVNGVYTRLGGQHVDSWCETIFRPIVDKFNKKGKPAVNIRDVKQFFRIFVSSTVINPEFNSQEKCVDPETLLLLWNGETIKAKNVLIGDKLIGDDGNPHVVTNMCSGESTMYEICQSKGETYKVNQHHILTLKCPEHKKINWQTKNKIWVLRWFDVESMSIKFHRVRQTSNLTKEQAYNLVCNKAKNIPDDNIFDVPISTFIKMDKRTAEGLYGFKSGCILWPHRDVLIDPYILGMWLGDGDAKGQAFSSDDEELIDAWRSWASDNDADIVHYRKYYYGVRSHSGHLNKINHRYVKNPLKEQLNKYNLIYNKHIPSEYLQNSEDIRLQVLAGIVDTDGCIQDKGTSLIIVQCMEHSQLIMDIIYLVRSLGLSCLHRIKDTQWKNRGEMKSGKAHHLHISGNLEKIPTLLNRKKGVSPSKQVGTSRLTVRDIGIGQYIGISLGTRYRFLLGDFTVTHNCRLENPAVQSAIRATDINAICRWSIAENIEDLIRGKEMSVLKKSERKKKGFVKIEGLDPANNAGGKDSDKCTLILCEGLSAKTYAVAGIEKGVYGRAGRDWWGVYPLRGKVLNVRNSAPTVISKNAVITDLIQATGLRHDQDYRDDRNFKQLNYGKIMLLTDSDVDGIHIEGLIINVIHSLFPTLLERSEPFVVSMKTPIVRVFRPRCSDLLFYDENKFKQFVLTQTKPFKKKYYKGLGTTKPEDVPDTFGIKMVEYINDEDTNLNMNKVFHKRNADDRKEWLANYVPNSSVSLDDQGEIVHMNISEFINNQMIKFSHDDCKRSIPNSIDGLKESQRKILYAVFLKKLRYSSTSLKVAQLGGYVAEKTNYHHGEQNLFETITKMANEFPGSNNIPLFYRDGMFGSRNSGGKDAASPRYIYTKMDMLTHLLFREEDFPLLEYNVDDGDTVEPKFYVPILPMILINGCSAGIGTGWSCNIPSYNPIDLINSVKEWLNNDGNVILEGENNTIISLLPSIHPWYRDFVGVIQPSGENRYITYGVIETNDNKTTVSELPISMWTDKFKEFCEDLIENKQIKGMKNYSTPRKPHFIISETQDGIVCNLENLKLHSYLYTSNMVLFDSDDKLRKFKNTDEIIIEFCKVRLEFYVKRKNYILNTLEIELKYLGNKARFIQEVIDEELVIMKREEEQIIKDLEDRNYDKDNVKIDDDGNETGGGYEYLLRLQVRTFTSGKIRQINEDIASLQQKINGIRSTSEKQMWINDLDEFEEQYHVFLRNMDKTPKNDRPKKNNKK